VIDELQRLREQGSSRIAEIQYTLRECNVPRYLNWHQTLKTIFFDDETPRTLSKNEKKRPRPIGPARRIHRCRTNLQVAG
jgi:hypothetical protein